MMDLFAVIYALSNSVHSYIWYWLVLIEQFLETESNDIIIMIRIVLYFSINIPTK